MTRINNVTTLKTYPTQIKKKSNITQNRTKQEAQKPNIILDKSVYKQLQTNCIVMHPLPRNEELPTEIDDDERSNFIQQMENGVYTRMAILDMFLDDPSYSEQPSVDVEIIEIEN